MCLTFRLAINKLATTEDVKQAIRTCIQSIAYANYEEIFNQSVKNMEEVATSDFIKYFHDNWSSCVHLWAAFKTKSYQNLRTRTNNRLERHNKELKTVLNSQITIADCIKGILRKAIHMKNKTTQGQFLSSVCVSYNVHDTNDTIKQIRNVATQYAANLTINQYQLAQQLKPNAAVVINASHYSVSLQGNLAEVEVNPKCSCSCSFWKITQLPCRHIFIIALQENLQFDDNWIPDRWRKSYQRQAFDFPCSTTAGIFVTSTETKKLNRIQKFKKMQQTLLKIGDICSEVSQEEFEHRFQQVSTLYQAWEKGLTVNIEVDLVHLEINQASTDVDKDEQNSNSHSSSQTSSKLDDNTSAVSNIKKSDSLSASNDIRISDNTSAGSDIIKSDSTSAVSNIRKSVDTPAGSDVRDSDNTSAGSDVRNSDTYTGNDVRQSDHNTSAGSDVRKSGNTPAGSDIRKSDDKTSAGSDKTKSVSPENKTKQNLKRKTPFQLEKDGLYLPRLSKVRGRPKGSMTSVLGISKRKSPPVDNTSKIADVGQRSKRQIKTSEESQKKKLKKNKVKLVQTKQVTNKELERNLETYTDVSNLKAVLAFLSEIRLNISKGINGSLKLLKIDSHDPANGIIYEAAQDSDLETVSDTILNLSSTLIQGETPGRRTDLFQLLSSTVLIAVKDGLDISSIKQMLTKRPSHLADLPETVVSIPKEKRKLGSTTFVPTDLETLLPGKWLNDQIIHCYLNLLMQEHPGKCYVLPCFLAMKWQKGQYQDWLYKKVDFGSFHWIFMPVHKNNHWFLLVVDMVEQTVGILNSLPNEKEESSILEQWDTYITQRSDVTGISCGKFRQIRCKSGRQHDGHSCGIFVLMNAEAMLNMVNPCVMRQHHSSMYRTYVMNRLIRDSKGNKNVYCDLPFCLKPSGKVLWVECDHCNRWCHFACCQVSSVDHRQPFKCVICK
ncbi:uncharacterized protein [Apostichopus japonicus]|uniref:uncharacterized protein n=1 Tax=Stichopus japonicus TaxID=307972 RepID=UPI003AB86A70